MYYHLKIEEKRDYLFYDYTPKYLDFQDRKTGFKETSKLLALKYIVLSTIKLPVERKDKIFKKYIWIFKTSLH